MRRTLGLLDFAKERKLPAPRHESIGSVIGTRGPLIIARLPLASIGDLCLINTSHSNKLAAQVVAFDHSIVSLAPLEGLDGVFPGAQIRNTARPLSLQIPTDPKGCVLDACGQLMESFSEHKAPTSHLTLSIDAPPPSSLKRQPIREILPTGIRSIDSLLSIGIGQRLGLFAPAGVGKSTLLGLIAKGAQVDLSVIALVGERGREVRSFIHDVLGTEGINKAVIVVSTSDESPTRRALAPKTATSIAEHFRSQGNNVLLLVDSLTRTARALREIGLAQGEIPVRQGYTPSVYSELPKLLERSGCGERGSITSIYSVLVEDDDEADPLAEEIKSLLDGHITLSRATARLGLQPPIDIVESNSRLFNIFHDKDYQYKRGLICRLLARLKKDKEILLLGGSPDPELLVALKMEESLKQ
ncbi:MAG: FliI/YscN family ATPase, partial [SAR324 cluster bacterium]|nr:FliI/YscN family ATPase [SAR324 cluster bacterium]